MSAWRMSTGRWGQGMLLALATATMLMLAMGASAYADCSRGFTNGLTEPSVIESIEGGVSWSIGGGHSILEGEGFEYASAVTVGDQPATNFTILSDEELEFVAPAEDSYAVEHEHSVEVIIVTPGGLSYSCPLGRNFLRYGTAKAPSILRIDPDSGPEAGGTAVTIEGSGFTQSELNRSAVTAVDFGPTSAAGFELLTSRKLRAIAPPGKGNQPVTITTAAGTSPGSERFTYEEPTPLPVVEFVEPDEGPPSGGNTVEIWAHHTEGLSAVKFGTHAATSFKETSVGGVIDAVVPPGSGTVAVTLTTAAGTSATSAKDRYNYVSGPTIGAIAPSAGPTAGGNLVKVTGTLLDTVTHVHFGGTEGQIYEHLSSSELIAEAPAGSGTVDVTVTAPGGTSPTSPADHYSYTSPPSITKLEPPFGPVAGGNPVRIIGSGLAGATHVRFESKQVSFSVDSEQEITAIAPPGQAGVGHYVVVETPGGSTPALFEANKNVYKDRFQPDVIVHPTEGPAAGGNTVTIEGNEFVEVASVTFGGVPATSFEVLSEFQIRAVAPPGHGTVQVVVSAAGGTNRSVSEDLYTYAPTPVVSGLTPSWAYEVTFETSVVVQGEHFVEPLRAEAGGRVVFAEVLSESELRLGVPRGSGTTEVRVTTTGGSNAAGGGAVFTYIPMPVITSVSPASGPEVGGTKVAITGTNLGHAPSVSFGASAAKAIQQVSETEIIATAPAGTGTVDVRVAGENGTSATSAADRYSYETAPAQPHFGRCSQVPAGPGKTYNGGYHDKKCEHVEPGHTGKYEWSPGLAKPTLTVSGGPISITVEWNRSVIECTSAGGSAELHGASALAGVEIVLHGCKDGSPSCSSGATAGDIATHELEGTIGFEFKGKGKVALELIPAGSEEFLSVSCGEEPIVLIHGVFAAVKAGKSATSLALTYKSAKGAQKQRAFEGATSFSSLEVMGAFSGALVNGTLKLGAEEPFEINPVV